MKKTYYVIIACLLILGVYFLYNKRASSRPYLTVVGYIDKNDGLGRSSYELINTFKDEFKIGFKITQQERMKLMNVSSDIKKIAKNSKLKMGHVVVFEECLWAPEKNYYKILKKSKVEDQIRIAYSVFESTKIPDEWVEILNTYFDAVAVPDEYLVSVYQNSGVEIPIFEIPLGLDLKSFLNEPIKTKCGKPFVFANLSTCLDRKNQLTLIQAFAHAFGNNPNVLLRINSRYGDPKTLKAVTKEIANLNLNNIRFTQLPLDEKEYLNLFLNVDCYVSLSKGEGFSIQPREAMALGIPVIVTDNTAQTTICKSDLVREVKADIVKPALYYSDLYHGLSFNCTKDDATAALLDVYENYSKYLDKAEAARSWVKQYENENLAGYFRNLLKPKNLILGKENKITEEFLMTNSIELHKKYMNLKKL